jgi:hypothetical protein
MQTPAAGIFEGHHGKMGPPVVQPPPVTGVKGGPVPVPPITGAPKPSRGLPSPKQLGIIKPPPVTDIKGRPVPVPPITSPRRHK